MCITPDGDHWWYQSRFSSNETHELSVFMHLKWYHRRLSSQGGGSTVGLLNPIPFRHHISANSFLCLLRQLFNFSVKFCQKYITLIVYFTKNRIALNIIHRNTVSRSDMEFLLHYPSVPRNASGLKRSKKCMKNLNLYD